MRSRADSVLPEKSGAVGEGAVAKRKMFTIHYIYSIISFSVFVTMQESMIPDVLIPVFVSGTEPFPIIDFHTRGYA
jgi:hypothetical protein